MRCSSLQVVGYPICLAVNTILLVMLYLTYNLSIQCPFLIFDCLPGFVSPYNQITLVSGGTQGRVSLSLPKALLNTLIRVRSRALAAFRGTFCQIRQKYVYELYFAPFPQHPLLSFSSPWSGLTSSNTHPLSPNPPPGCPITQLMSSGGGAKTSPGGFVFLRWARPQTPLVRAVPPSQAIGAGNGELDSPAHLVGQL